MSVTARLSKLFYDRLGEEVTNELVDWINAVDATYRADLRELNELNFARFDAKLEQRVAGLEAKLEKGLTELRAEFNTKLVEATASLETKLTDRIGAAQTGMMRSMFGFWLGTILPLAGLMLALNTL